LIDQAQKEPVSIEKQGRPVAVILSFDTYYEQLEAIPNEQEKKQALQFLKKWSGRPTPDNIEAPLKGDPRAQAIWDKYTQKA